MAMEKKSSDTNSPSFPLFPYIFLSLFNKILTWVNSNQKLLSRFWSLLQSQIDSGNSEIWDEKRNLQLSSRRSSFNEKKDEKQFLSEEVEMVMGKLGIFCSPEGEKLQVCLSSNELSRLFDEEPSLEEVKEAFEVFDENRDGFVDAWELQRVICILGLKEGSELDNCRKMITTFDENGDGRIDFNEFVKLMEASFC